MKIEAVPESIDSGIGQILTIVSQTSLIELVFFTSNWIEFSLSTLVRFEWS